LYFESRGDRPEKFATRTMSETYESAGAERIQAAVGKYHLSAVCERATLRQIQKGMCFIDSGFPGPYAILQKILRQYA
jgi:hypothetical protein